MVPLLIAWVEERKWGYTNINLILCSLIILCSIRNSDIEQQSSPQNYGVDPKSWGGIIFKYWHAMFVVSCVIAVLCVDPLFFYLPVINQDHKCLALDRRLKVTAICVRSVFDLIYLVNIILGFLCPYKDEDASRRCERTVSVTDARRIAMRYLSSYFTIDILAILPIPQVRETLYICSLFFLRWPTLNSLIFSSVN